MLDVQELADSSVRTASLVAPAFYRIADVMRLTALSRATIYRRIADGRFPHPVHLGGRACGWPPKELQAWIDNPTKYRAPPVSVESKQMRPHRNFRRLNRPRLFRQKFRTQVGHEGSIEKAKEKAPTGAIP
jgi:Predicted transcriptional regulator